MGRRKSSEEEIRELLGIPDYFIGTTKVLIYGNTLQVNDYSNYDWTMFYPEEKSYVTKPLFLKRKMMLSF